MQESIKKEISKQSIENQSTEEKREEKNTLSNVATAIGTGETVQRYGSAIAEDYVAYTGTRLNPDGTVTNYQKSHSKIFKHKINPDYKENNIAQQAGFNAEVNHVTQENKKAIINGNQTRTTRTDDIGKVNDTVSDIVSLDSQGNIIAGSEGQMKFVSNPQKVCDGIAGLKAEGGKDDLTRYQGKKLLLPTEDTEAMKQYCKDQSTQLRQQAEKIKDSNPELSNKRIEQADRFDELSKNIEDAGFSREQAKAYRQNPIKETAKSIGRTAHDAGLQSAKYGAAIGGTVSIVSNVYATIQGDKELGDAVIDCTKDTIKSAAVGYATGAAGSAIKGTMEQSFGVLQQKAINVAVQELGEDATQLAIKKASEKAVEKFASSTTGNVTKRLGTLSKSNLPTLAVTVCLEFGGLVRKYAKGEIDGVEFMEQVGEKGVAITASTAMAAVGQVAIPIPVVGAVIGGMIGYTLSSMFYNEALNAFKEAKQAHQNYLYIKARYEEAKRQRDIYQAELQKQFDLHMNQKRQELSIAFTDIALAIESGNMDLFAQSVNQIGGMFNKELQFKNRSEFDDFMNSNETLTL